MIFIILQPKELSKTKTKKKIDKSVNNNKFIFIETVLRIE